MINQWLSEQPTRRRMLTGLFAGGFSFFAGCNWDGHFNLLGYSTKPNFNPNFRTIYVPVFRNKVLQWYPHRSIEMELQRALIREIESTTPMKVINDPNRADTELLGTVVMLNKNLLNRSQENEVREGELTVGVELVWRDLATKKVLSNPPKPIGVLPAEELPPFDPNNPPQPEDLDPPRPVVITFGGRYLPEVGETNASAQTRVCNRLARQIVNMMEQSAPRIARPVPSP